MNLITAGPSTKLFAWGGGGIGGHVLRETTSRSLYGLVCPSRQNLADLTSWNSSALQTLKQLHGNLLTHYNCTEWAPPLADDPPATDTPAQGHDNDSARPLSLPPLNLLASLCVWQDEDNVEVAACPS